MGHGHETGARSEEALVLVEEQFAAVVHRDDADDDAAPVAQQLPGDDVAVVFHDGEDDLVAFLHAGFAEGCGQEVDALGGAAREDDFVRGAGVQEAAHRLARCLVQLGGLLGEEVHAAVHVGIDGVVFVGNGIDHATGLLRGGSVIQIDERAAIDRAAQDGKVFPDFLYIVHVS